MEIHSKWITIDKNGNKSFIIEGLMFTEREIYCNLLHITSGSGYGCNVNLSVRDNCRRKHIEIEKEDY